MTDATDPPPRNWSALFLFILVAAALIAFGLVLLGIPGAIVAVTVAPLVELVRGVPLGTFTEGDSAWGVAILMTIAFPPGLPLSYWISSRLWPDLDQIPRALTIIGGTWLWSLMAMLVLSFQV